MKKLYKEHCGLSVTGSGPFDILVELCRRVERLEQRLRDASQASEEIAEDAIREAQDEVEEFIATTRSQLSAVRTTIRETVSRLRTGLNAARPGPAMFHGTRENPFTVVSVDMKGYGDISRKIEDYAFTDAKAVLEFNREIRNHMSEALKAEEIAPENVWREPAGDGEILIFRGPHQAVLFARAFRERIRALNVANQGTNKCFRTGIASGRVCISETRDHNGQVREFEMGGSVIADAVRIQSACAPEEIMMCENTFMALDPTRRKDFPYTRTVRGKPHENLRITAYSTHSGKGYFYRLCQALLGR